MGCLYFFFFKQKTAYEIYQCDWSSDVCSSDLEDVLLGKTDERLLERQTKINIDRKRRSEANRAA